jgi:SAM-dependent methyltransferase
MAPEERLRDLALDVRAPALHETRAGRSAISEELHAFVEEMPFERRSILAYVHEVADSLRPGAVVLDVGAGKAPYRELFEHCRYVTADWEGSLHEHAVEVDFVAGADALALGDATVDAVLLTQVLEHVVNPAGVLSEAARVLGARGKVFLTVPFVWELHELPFDFWRFTPASLERLLEDAGFGEIEIRPRNDCFTTVAQLMRNLGSAMGRAPDGRDEERDQAAELLAQLADRVAALAPLDASGILPLGWTATARRS